MARRNLVQSDQEMDDIMQDIETTDLSSIMDWFRKAFDSAQKSTANHEKCAIQMMQLINRIDLKTAFEELQNALSLTLPVQKSETCAEFEIQFFATLFLTINKAITTQNYMPDNNLDLYKLTRLIQAIFEWLLECLQAKDRIVRYRICQILSASKKCLDSLSPDFCDHAMNLILKRAGDKDSSVRLQSLKFLASVRSSEHQIKFTEAMLYLLQHDPVADVRSFLLDSLDLNTKTLPFILERARDIDPHIRKSLYANCLKKLENFKFLKIDQRIHLIQCGLYDRDEQVKKAASHLFTFDWLKNVDNNIIELLERIDVMNNQHAPKIIHEFFDQRNDALKAITFSKEFWQNLTAEGALLVRCFNDYCKVDGESKYQIDEKMPELSELCEYLDLELKNLSNSVSRESLTFSEYQISEAFSEQIFIIQQLLLIIQTYDFADEIGRNKVFAMAKQICTSINTDQRLLEPTIKLHSLLCISTIDLIRLLQDILGELKENNDTFNDNDYDSDQSFKSAKSNIQIATNEDDLQDNLDHILFRQSIILNYFLQQIQKVENISNLDSLVEVYIFPAIKNNRTTIREYGLLNLGLCCLLNLNLTLNNVKLFAHCLLNGHESLQIVALKILTDLTCCYGINNIGISSQEFSNLIKSCFKKDNYTEITTTATLACCKLFLTGVHFDQNILTKLIVNLFDPAYSDNQTSCQSLAFFFPAFSSLKKENQQKLVDCVPLAFHDLCRLAIEDDTFEENHQSLQNILVQLASWCDSRNLVKDSQMPNHDSHCILALNLLKSIANTRIKIEKINICTLLPKLNIQNASQPMIKELLLTLEKMASIFQIMDVSYRNSIAKFRQALLKVNSEF